MNEPLTDRLTQIVGALGSRSAAYDAIPVLFD